MLPGPFTLLLGLTQHLPNWSLWAGPWESAGAASAAADPFHKTMEQARTFSSDRNLTTELSEPFIEATPGAR